MNYFSSQFFGSSFFAANYFGNAGNAVTIEDYLLLRTKKGYLYGWLY